VPISFTFFIEETIVRKTVQIASLLVGAALLGSVALPTWAIDGVILIDQNKAMAGNVTPGDTPGFPVTISLPGSYRLAGNLTVPDGNTSAIVIAADHVTIDLNGFAILGPVDCSGGFPCAGIGLQQGYGIQAGSDTPVKSYFNITVRNGTIQGMGADGIHLLGDAILLEDLHIRSNGLSGIVVRSPGANSQINAILHHNTVQLNSSYGIKAYAGVITDNTVSQSGSEGISVQIGGGVVARNLVSRNFSFGLSLTPNVSYSGNTMVDNNSGGAQVGGGVNVGQNLCGTAVCPGAQF
jgi:hypothetical protein